MSRAALSRGVVTPVLTKESNINCCIAPERVYTFIKNMLLGLRLVRVGKRNRKLMITFVRRKQHYKCVSKKSFYSVSKARFLDNGGHFMTAVSKVSVS